MKICFGTIEGLPIWFFANKGIFVSQNSYGYKSSFSRFSFRLRDNQSKMCFKLIIYWIAKLKPILESKCKLICLWNGLKFIFERFLRLRDNQSKMGFNLSIYWVASRAKFSPREQIWTTNEFYTSNNIFVWVYCEFCPKCLPPFPSFFVTFLYFK